MEIHEANLAQQLRETIDQKPLEQVLRAAGATRIAGQATEVLREAAAAQAAARLLRRPPQGPTRPEAPSAKLLDAAAGALRIAALEKAAPAALQALLAREISIIAREAAEFARADGNRPVCHNCVAVGAARAAAADAVAPQLLAA